MHHIVSDGWSMGIFKNELSTLYSAFHDGLPDPLHPLGIQYADYAVWQRKWLAGDRLQQQAAYWKSTLSGAPALLELPADHPRPFQQDYRGDSVGLVLDRDLTAALKQAQSKTRHDHVYDDAGGLGGTSRPPVGPEGHRHWDSVGRPRPYRSRGPDRILHQHPGASSGPVGLSHRGRKYLRRPGRSPSLRSSSRIYRSNRLSNFSSPYAASPTLLSSRSCFAWQNNDDGTLELSGLEQKALGLQGLPRSPSMTLPFPSGRGGRSGQGWT